MDKTADLARGRWRSILTYLGIHEKFLKPEHGPCPVCGGQDRFRFDDKDGKGTYYCGSCGAGNGFTLLQNFHSWDFATAAAEVDRIMGNTKMESVKQEQTEQQKLENIKTVLKESKRLVVGDPVWTYLDSRCGPLDPSRVLDLRYHPGLYHPEAGMKLPCMIGIMRYPNNDGATLHRTFLTPEGKKANVASVRRLMPGKTILGSAVRIGLEHHTVCLAEGIETTLCAATRMGVPGFAAISAEGMKAWDPPAYVRKVFVMGDNDSSFTGQAAAFHIARELVLQHKLEVEVLIPEVADQDWCDLHKRVQLQE